MFKFGHLGDAHIGFRQYGLEQRRSDFELAFTWAIDKFIEEKVSFVLIAGDLFHHKNPDFSDMNFVAKELKRLKNLNIKVYAIWGNHDAPSRTDKSSWTEDFLNRGLIHNGRFEIHGCFDNIWVNIITQNWAGSDTEKYIRQLPTKKEFYNILVLHGGPTTENMVGQFNLKTLQDYKDRLQYIALGHIHEPSIIDNFIVTPGSLETNSSNEWKYKGRGVVVVTVNKGLTHTIETFEVPNRQTYYKKISWYQDKDELFAQLDIPKASLVQLDIVGTVDLPIKPIQLSLFERRIVEKFAPLHLSIFNKTRVKKNLIQDEEVDKSTIFKRILTNEALAELCSVVKENRANLEELDKVITDYVNNKAKT